MSAISMKEFGRFVLVAWECGFDPKAWQVRIEMEKQGLRQANTRDLKAFDKMFPKEKEYGPIVALGSTRSRGGLGTNYITDLGLFKRRSDGFSNGCRFLAVRD